MGTRLWSTAIWMRVDPFGIIELSAQQGVGARKTLFSAIGERRGRQKSRGQCQATQRKAPDASIRNHGN